MSFVSNSQLKRFAGDVKDAIENGTIVSAKALSAKSIDAVSEESGTIQDNPFILQGSGTNNNEDSVDTSPVAKQLEKRGNTVVVNQLLQNSYFQSASGGGLLATIDNDGVITATGTATGSIAQIYCCKENVLSVISGHKYLLMGDYVRSFGSLAITTPNTIGEATSTGYTRYYLVINGLTVDTSYTFKTKPRLIDLTLWFGSNDKIPTHLLNHPEDFFRYYQGSLAYNVGTLTNCNARYLKTTGRNVWDEEWENGYYNAQGEPMPASGSIRSKNSNPISVIPNKTYYFYCNGLPLFNNEYAYIIFLDANQDFIGTKTIYGTSTNKTFITPANCAYIKFFLSTGYGTTYNHDITISLYYEGESGYDQYYPYEELANIDTGDEELLAFDQKEPNGTIHHNTLPKIDLGDLTWYKYADYHAFYAILNGKAAGNRNLICSKYAVVSIYSDANDKCVFGNESNNTIYVKDTAYDSLTKEEFKTAISGVYMEVKAATPTTEQGTPFAENIAIDDFGTMYWLDTDNNLVSIPQGCKMFYPADYVLYTDTLLNYTEGDPENIALKGELASGDPDTIKGVVDYVNAKVQDLSSDVTDNAELTYIIKKAYKFWNIVSLTIRATSSSAITAGTKLMTLASGLYNASGSIRCWADISGTASAISINTYGEVSCSNDIPNGSALVFTVVYAVE